MPEGVSMKLGFGIWMAAVWLLTAAALPAQQNPRPLGTRPGFPPDIVPPVLSVTGIDGKTVPFVAVALAKLPKQTVKTGGPGTPVEYQGVLLSDVLAKVDIPLGEKFHKTAASYYLVAEAADGYRAVFSWAELDPSIAEKPVYVVFQRDGKDLPEKEGPFELVVPGEKRNARWVRQLQALRILQVR
jgi:hypothetical protein